MESNVFSGNASQWILCLIQVTGLLLGSWTFGRLIRGRFPDIAASIGMVAMGASVTLVGLTFADIPRPFELSANRAGSSGPDSTSNHNSLVTAQSSKANSNLELSTLLARIEAIVHPQTGDSQSSFNKTVSRWPSTSTICGYLLFLTLLGGMAGIIRFVHSSFVIHFLTRSSILVEDQMTQAELSRIMANIPDEHKNISIRKFNGSGSPFVSWLTGNTIYVPENFHSWSSTERTASLAHEVSHLLRRDHFGYAAIQLAFGIMWLHPIAWVLHRQTVLNQELAADQMAAQLTKNSVAYCRGLSRLALRFDAECRHTSAIGVSLSSNLIRRITMLRKSKFHRLPCSQSVNRVVTSAAFVACSFLGCWSVAAKTLPQENQRDAKVVAASHTSPIKTFSQPIHRPWDSVGDQPGYVSLQARRILNHPDLRIYRPILSVALNSALRSPTNKNTTSKQFGLAIEDIELIQSGMLLSYRYDDSQPNGSRSQLSLGASNLEITSENPVDWPGLIKAIDVEKLSALVAGVPATDLEAVQEAWAESANKGRTNLFQLSALMGKNSIEWKKHSETKKVLWKAVSGGVATVVYDIVQSGDVPENYQEDDDFNQANLEMTTATQTAAWGIDLTPDYKNCEVRFAAVPKEGVSMKQLMSKFEAVKNALMTSDADDEFSKHLAQQLKKAKVSIVQGKTSNGEMTASYLLVEGECSADISKYNLIKNVAAPPRSEAEAKGDRDNH